MRRRAPHARSVSLLPLFPLLIRQGWSPEPAGSDPFPSVLGGSRKRQDGPFLMQASSAIVSPGAHPSAGQTNVANRRQADIRSRRSSLFGGGPRPLSSLSSVELVLCWTNSEVAPARMSPPISCARRPCSTAAAASSAFPTAAPGSRAHSALQRADFEAPGLRMTCSVAPGVRQALCRWGARQAR